MSRIIIASQLGRGRDSESFFTNLSRVFDRVHAHFIVNIRCSDGVCGSDLIMAEGADGAEEALEGQVG